MSNETKSFLSGFSVGAVAVLANAKAFDACFLGAMDGKSVVQAYVPMAAGIVAGSAFAKPSNKFTYALGAYMGVTCSLIPIVAGVFRPKAKMSLDEFARKAAMDF